MHNQYARCINNPMRESDYGLSTTLVNIIYINLIGVKRYMNFSFKGLEVIAVLYLLFLSIILICLIWVFICDRKVTKEQEKHEEEKEKKLIESGYVKPTFKHLTKEQIDDIHSR